MIEINDDVKIYFPLKYKPRKIQYDMLFHTIKSVSTGHKFTLLNAPTGIGKSFFAMMFINWYLNIVNENAKFDIVTNSKLLQDQYKTEFDFIQVLKGKSNYRCDKFDTDCETGMQLCFSLKQQCKDCPYEKEKTKYINSSISSANFHLFDSLYLFSKTFSLRESNVLIVDEAHDFENVFSDYISTSLSARSMKKFGFADKVIKVYDEWIKSIFDKIKDNNYKPNQFIGWINSQLKPDLEALKEQFTDELENANSKRKELLSSYLSSITTRLANISKIDKMFKEDENNWVLEIDRNLKERMYSGCKVDIKPIWIKDILPEIWQHYDHIIFMSGTILDRTMFSFISGIDKNLASYYSVESPFLIKNRPIYYIKLGKMTYNQKKETFKQQKVYIEKILNKNKGKKGIIHCFSYELADWIKKSIYDKRMLFHDSENRDEILSKHLSSESDTVLVSPSMYTGLDLKDDLSRFQMILKVPYPNISSEKIKARQNSNKEWYSYRTCMDIIQAYGRSVRSEDDFCETYVLDESFSDLLRFNDKYLPRWFTDAVKVLKTS